MVWIFGEEADALCKKVVEEKIWHAKWGVVAMRGAYKRIVAL